MNILGVPFEPLRDWYESLDQPWKFLVGLLVIVVSLGGLLFKTLKFVQQGEMGIRKRFGKPILHYDKSLSLADLNWQKEEDRKALATGPVAIYGRPRYVRPGWNLMIPFIHGIEIVQVKHPTIKLDDMIVMALEMLRGKIYRDTQATLEITDPYIWHYRFDNPSDYLKGCINSALWLLLDSYGYERLALVNIRQLELDLLKQCTAEFEQAGARLMPLGLTLASPRPVPETVLAEAIMQKPLSLTSGVEIDRPQLVTLAHVAANQNDAGEPVAN